MSLFINTNNGPIYSGCNVTVINGKTETTPAAAPVRPEPATEDVEPVDTSFFCADRFTPQTIEKNLREAIAQASSKADACRRIMALETQGYLLLSNVKDDKKAELVNPFAAPKFRLNGQDFRQARNR